MKKNIVVIGSGLAGALLCNQLSDHHHVTLLEKGPENTIHFPTVRFVNKKLAEVHTFCLGGGGTTNLWHNGLIPINPQDITNQTFREVLNEASPFINQAADNLFFKGLSFVDEYEKLVDEMNAMTATFKSFPHGIDCLLYPKKFTRLKVNQCVNAHFGVESIDFVAQNGKIRSVDFTVAQQGQSLATDLVVLAAGAMGTPNLLQKIITSLGAEFNKVGLGFIDHPMGFVGKVKFKANIAPNIKQLSSYDRGTYISRSAVRLKSKCGRYTACAFFRPAITMDNDLAIYKYKSSLGASRGMARLRKIFSLKLFHPDVIAEVFAHLFGANIPSRTYNILFVAEQKRGSNRVYFEDGKFQVDWTISAEEMTIYRDMLNSFQQMLAGIADDINMEVNINDDWLWSAAHHSCTTPLGGSEDDLIDKNLKLKYCDNVFVCDGSVIQEHSYANTGLAIAQLACRLTKRICDGDKR